MFKGKLYDCRKCKKRAHLMASDKVSYIWCGCRNDRPSIQDHRHAHKVANDWNIENCPEPLLPILWPNNPIQIYLPMSHFF